MVYVKKGEMISSVDFTGESLNSVFYSGKNSIVVRADGHGIPELLEAILKLFPLDTYVEAPVMLMQVTPGDDVDPVIWKDYRKIVDKHQDNVKFKEIERFAFYERAKKAYAIIATGETAIYANIILKKGVITP